VEAALTEAPRVTAEELIRALHKDGWEIVRQRGSHRQLKHAVKPGTVTVPVHTGKVIPPDVLSVVLKRAGLDPGQLQKLL
jgi:predicted RNA binding protein YcfA (HicA-like mRNA interferase family)